MSGIKKPNLQVQIAELREQLAEAKRNLLDAKIKCQSYSEAVEIYEALLRTIVGEKESK